MQNGTIVEFYARTGQRAKGKVVETYPVPPSGDYPIVKIECDDGSEFTRRLDDVDMQVDVTLHMTIPATEEIFDVAHEISRLVQHHFTYRVDDWDIVRVTDE